MPRHDHLKCVDKREAQHCAHKMVMNESQFDLEVELIDWLNIDIIIIRSQGSGFFTKKWLGSGVGNF